MTPFMHDPFLRFVKGSWFCRGCQDTRPSTVASMLEDPKGAVTTAACSACFYIHFAYYDLINTFRALSSEPLELLGPSEFTGVQSIEHYAVVIFLKS